MNTASLASLAQHLWPQYHWLLSIFAGVGIILVTLLGKQLAVLVPGFRAAGQLNKDTFRKKMERPSYAANQKWNRKWSVVYLLVIFGVILPFCLTAKAQPWWRMPLDIVVILMVYDFFYYFTHRFLFHDSGVFVGPLLWMHAVHHRQHNPCRWDASYIHPLEIAIGLGLYVATIFILSRFMGGFNVATIVITWVAFTEINLHNHDLWDGDRFPGKYLNTMSQMHHNHHAKFTGGNYATISLLYDWMFGTLDYGTDRKTNLKA
jgi:sterol desaturase/sphingolipid hydroxylase (fatty acid hydroxylase superfamily)